MSRKDKAQSGEYIFRREKDAIKFIGNFEGLYKNVDDPWGQKSDIYYKQRRLEIVKEVTALNPSYILDVGCGFGHTTQALNILACKTLGVDISHTAIEKASCLFPEVEFKVCDISKKVPDKFDVIILDGILWYILYDLEKILVNIQKHLMSGGYLVIAQAFIPDQQFGLDIIDGYEGLLKYLLEYQNLYTFIKSSHRDVGYRKTDSITILQRS